MPRETPPTEPPPNESSTATSALAGPPSAGSVLPGAPPAVRAEVDRWTSVGLITPEQAAGILRYEATGAAPPSAHRPPVVLPHPEPTVVAGGAAPPRAALAVEVVAYLGASLMASAVMGIVARQWRDVAFAGRLVMVGVPTVVAGVVGWMLHRRTGPLGRLASVAWLLGLAGAAGTSVLVLTDGLDVADHTVATVTLALVATLALLAWWVLRAPLQLVALVGTSTGLVAAVMQQAGVERPVAFGFVVLGLGLCWFAQSRRPWLEPKQIGMAAGLVTAFIGAQIVGGDWEVVGLALAAVGSLAVMGLSVADRSTPELLLGALGLFISLPRLMFTWLGDSVGAPVALLLCGGLLVGVAVRVARTRGGNQPTAPSSGRAGAAH